MYSRIRHKALISRIKRASLREIVNRIKQNVLIWALSVRYGRKRTSRVPRALTDHVIKKLKLPDFYFNADIKIINRILEGHVFCLNLPKSELEKMLAAFSSLFFSKIKVEKPFFDIRPLWEPARLQHITILLAYLKKHPTNSLTVDIKQYCAAAVLEWISCNPFLFGPHYLSAMECGLRIPVFFYCLKMLDNLKSSQTKKILEAIYLHAWWISKRLSLYSSSGNHTIAESVGLIFAGSIFSNIIECQDWLRQGRCLLESELSHQVLDDGGPAEQSFHYLRFVLDLYWLAINYLEINKLYDCLQLKKKLISAENFLSSFQSSIGDTPSIGDSDDGCAVAPNVAPWRSESVPRKRTTWIYKQSGYTIVNTTNKACLVFDHGPLGLAPLYGHGHADALSIMLSKDKKQIFVDPGTYRYNGSTEWRRYFKSTRAHNTVTIDRLDQAIQETEFIWTKPYHVKLLGFSEHRDRFFINAVHNGYARLKKPVWHRRDISFCWGNCFLIKDYFQGQGVHHFELNFHLHPNAQIIKLNGWWQIANQSAMIYMRLLEESDFMIINGQEKPIHGWYSSSYGEKIKSSVLTCQKSGSPDEIFFNTAICTESPPDLEKLQEKASVFA